MTPHTWIDFYDKDKYALSRIFYKIDKEHAMICSICNLIKIPYFNIHFDIHTAKYFEIYENKFLWISDDEISCAEYLINQVLL